MPSGSYERTKIPCDVCGREISYVHMASHKRAFHEGQGSTEYFASHWRIRKILGKPPACYLCSENKKRRCWANLSGDYGDPGDYIPLCDSCHQHFDAKEKNNLGDRTYIRCKICNKLVRSKKSWTTHKYCSKKCMISDSNWRKQLTGRPKKI